MTDPSRQETKRRISPSLFAYFSQPVENDPIKQVKKWLKENRRSVLPALIISIFIHVFVAAAAGIYNAIKPPSKKKAPITRTQQNSYAAINTSIPASSSPDYSSSRSTAARQASATQQTLPALTPSFRSDTGTPDADLDYLKRLTPLKNNSGFAYGREQVRVETDTGNKYVPSVFFFRDSPHKKIATAGAGQFLVVKGFPAIQQPTLAPTAAKRDKFTSSDLAIQEILDELMQYPEAKQIDVLQQQYLERYDLNSKDLVILTQQFFKQNLGRVFFDLGDVSSAYDYLEEVHFKTPLVKDLHDFWRRYPTSRIGIEFLLALAEQYAFERRALEFLYKAYDDAVAFVERRILKAEIYDKKAKSSVIKNLYLGLNKKLPRIGYASQKEVLDKYTTEEKKIYAMIAKMEGDIKNIGLYKLGALYWRLSSYDSALQTWDKTDSSFKENIALEEIRDVQAKFQNSKKIRIQIDAILEWHAIKDNAALMERLIKFGRWKKRYAN